MAEWNVERAYRQLVDNGLSAGRIELRAGTDQREEPRFQMHKREVAVRVEPRLKLVDLSASGVALLSEQAFQPGEVLQLILKDALAFKVQVEGCDLVETDTDLLEMRYRVRCRFNDEGGGKQFLVLMEEFDAQQ